MREVTGFWIDLLVCRIGAVKCKREDYVDSPMCK